jgi:hypothetical protein
MKTDKQKLAALLTEFGIKFEEKMFTVTLEVDKFTKGSKIFGYSGFSADFNFNDDGKFLTMEIWE